LNFKGTWNASTNTPALASGVGTKGDYFVVGVAGATTLDGISTWGVGDWATYNGSVWQRVEGGADLEGVNLNVSGTTNLAALTASTALALDVSKNVVSVTNTGTGNNVLGTSPTMATPTLTGDVQMSTGNLVVGTSGKGIDFSATPGTGTSELLNDYEEGTWTPGVSDGTNNATMGANNGGKYTKTGNCVTFSAQVTVGTIDSVGANARITGLPFVNQALTANRAGVAFGYGSSLAITQGRVVTGYVEINNSFIELQYWDAVTGTTGLDGSEITDGGTFFVSGHYYVS
jgi:hypothetical protein